MRWSSSVNETAAAIEEMTRSIQGGGHERGRTGGRRPRRPPPRSTRRPRRSRKSRRRSTVSRRRSKRTARRPKNWRGRSRASRRAARRISDAASAAATSATELDRASQSVATLAKEADEITRRASRDAEEGGVSVQRSIQGFGRVRESMTQSATVIREMGKRAQRHQQHRRHHQPDRRADEPAVAERVDRGGARRRRRPRICRRRRGDPEPGRSVGQGDVRHRRDHQGAAGGGAGGGRRRPTRGCGSIDESNVQADEGAKGLRKILDGVDRGDAGRRPDHPGRDEQREAAEARRGGDHRDRRTGAAGRRRDRRAGEVGDGLVQANAQIRKTTQEVKKAMAEQARAARDILKAAQNTRDQAGAGAQGDRRNRSRPPTEITKAAESMRRGAVTTARAMAEQATAGEQISRSADGAAADGRRPSPGR